MPIDPILFGVGLDAQTQDQCLAIPAKPGCTRVYNSDWRLCECTHYRLARWCRGGISSILAIWIPISATMGDRASPPIAGIS